MDDDPLTRFGPPLPEALLAPQAGACLPPGAYLIRLALGQSPAPQYVGVLRVHGDGGAVAASGDLYLDASAPPAPAAGPMRALPVFPRRHYRHYLRVTAIEPQPPSLDVRIGFERYGYAVATRSWSRDETLSGHLARRTAPAEFAGDAPYFAGPVRSASGTAGQIAIGWVSSALRRAVVEVDRVAAAPFPRNNGDDRTPVTWRKLFAAAGWDLVVRDSDRDVREPSGASWSDDELHAQMLRWREGPECRLDEEWLYHLLCVRRLDRDERGVMYDCEATDSNHVPREGAALAAGYRFGDVVAWGRVRGQSLGAAGAPYFRTAVHEIGHAMGLAHDTGDNGIMCPSDTIAGRQVGDFPDNVGWGFSPEDRHRLRHLPDPVVRPGMLPFADFGGRAADGATEAKALRLRLSPLLPAVPLGAPVRVNLELHNAGEEAHLAPARLDLGAGSVTGSATGPDGTTHFRSLFRCLDRTEMRPLVGGGSLLHALTLLRGPQGSLFPKPGDYRIQAVVRWQVDGQWLKVTGETTVAVTAPAAADQAHRVAAQEVLSAPDVLLTLALKSDIPSGVAAVRRAISCPALRPHFAVIEAKREGASRARAPTFTALDGQQARAPGLKRALLLIDEDAVLSGSEIGRVAGLVRLAQAFPGELGPETERVIGVLKRKITRVLTDAATVERVNAL